MLTRPQGARCKSKAGCKAKAKDLSFKAKAKNFGLKARPRPNTTDWHSNL